MWTGGMPVRRAIRLLEQLGTQEFPILEDEVLRRRNLLRSQANWLPRTVGDTHRICG